MLFFRHITMYFAIISNAIFLHYVSGLTCYDCNSQYSSSDLRCFGFDNTTLPNEVTCASDTATDKYYCRTRFRWYQGRVNYVRRQCISARSDEDQTTTNMPNGGKCQTYGIGTEHEYVDCYSHCFTDNCNNASAGTYKPCEPSCQNGYCQIQSGQCICSTGWKGQTCSFQETRECVQCTSLTDETCEMRTQFSNCPSGEMFCSNTKTTTFDQDGAKLSDVVVKGCSQSATKKNCRVFRHGGNRWLYTCYETCAEDGCNVGADFYGAPEEGLQCVQCRSEGQGCFSWPQRCPMNSTHCKATVSFLYNENVNNQNASYFVLEMVRECASSAVPTQCNEEYVDGIFVKTTCQETCRQHGCNNAWPARPKCMQCSATYKDYYVGYCLTVGPLPEQCPYPYQSHCTTKHIIGKSGESPGISVIERGCDTHDIETRCDTDTANNATREICTEACTTDACNTGYVGPKEDLTEAVLAVSYYSP